MRPRAKEAGVCACRLQSVITGVLFKEHQFPEPCCTSWAGTVVSGDWREPLCKAAQQLAGVRPDGTGGAG